MRQFNEQIALRRSRCQHVASQTLQRDGSIVGELADSILMVLTSVLQ